MAESVMLHLELDVPSGVLVVGDRLEAMAPLPPGEDGFSINSYAGMAADSQARAAEHLIQVYLPDAAWRVSHGDDGSLAFQATTQRMPAGHTVALRLPGVRNLGLMDGDDYAHQVLVLAEEGDEDVQRLSVPPGRYRFTFDYADPQFWEPRKGGMQVGISAVRVGPAQPIVRAPLNHGPAETFEASQAHAVLQQICKRGRHTLHHPAQALGHLLVSGGNGFDWVRGQLTDQASSRPDAPVFPATTGAAGKPPKGVVVPSFPALTTLGPCGADNLWAKSDLRSPGLRAPLHADRHWLALMLVFFHSLSQAPGVAGTTRSQDDRAQDQATRSAYRQVCALVHQANRWDELVQTLAEMAPFWATLQAPAARFSERQRVIWMHRMLAMLGETKEPA